MLISLRPEFQVCSYLESLFLVSCGFTLRFRGARLLPFTCLLGFHPAFWSLRCDFSFHRSWKTRRQLLPLPAPRPRPPVLGSTPAARPLEPGSCPRVSGGLPPTCLRIQRVLSIAPGNNVSSPAGGFLLFHLLPFPADGSGRVCFQARARRARHGPPSPRRLPTTVGRSDRPRAEQPPKRARGGRRGG